MLTGNKGEWSEIYVFLKLLADGRLNAADANLNAIPNVYYPIIKILRQENTISREYKINGNIIIVDGDNNELLNLPISEFVSRSQQVFNELKNAEGRSFAFADIETFLNSIDIHSLTALKTDKADIKVVVHDLNTGMQPKLGFSIKSMLGGNSTLFNPGNTTNFIYEILGEGELNIAEINGIEATPKIANRISEIRRRGFEVKFQNIQSATLQLNLQLIDSDLPNILAELLLLKYSTPGLALLAPTLGQLTKNNPLHFDLSQGHPFYEYKIKNFLTDSALGMTPATMWTGQYDATGGIIIVKANGELVCYHIYNRNEFQNYLLNNTRLEQASTSRYNFGDLYNENGRTFLKLNLQVRFN
jgi:hypothetical protein